MAHEAQLFNQKLLEDQAVEDFQYHYYVVEKIHKGIARAGSEGVITQEEVERQFSKWISTSTL